MWPRAEFFTTRVKNVTINEIASVDKGFISRLVKTYLGDLEAMNITCEGAQEFLLSLEKYPQTLDVGIWTCKSSEIGLISSKKPPIEYPENLRIYITNVNDFDLKVGDVVDIEVATLFLAWWNVKTYVNSEMIGLVTEVKSKKVCPECGRPVRRGDEFCGHCGAEIKGRPGSKVEKDKTTAYVPVTCPACGHSNRPRVKFCAGCGRGLR